MKLDILVELKHLQQALRMNPASLVSWSVEATADSALPCTRRGDGSNRLLDFRRYNEVIKFGLLSITHLKIEPPKQIKIHKGLTMKLLRALFLHLFVINSIRLCSPKSAYSRFWFGCPS